MNKKDRTSMPIYEEILKIAKDLDIDISKTLESALIRDSPLIKNGDDINKYIVIHLRDLKVKNTICKCGYRFYYVGSKVICPRCKRIFTPR